VPAQRPKVRGFAAAANQTVTEAAVAGCQFPTGPAGSLCTTRFSGTGTAAHLGEVTITSTLTADWSQPINTGPDGFCAPVAGSATLQAVATSKQNRGPLPLQITGTVCETSADGDSYPLVFTGQYRSSRARGAMPMPRAAALSTAPSRAPAG
jgi:hypothetical protein